MRAPTHRARPQAPSHPRRGSNAIEFALLLPVFVTVLGASFDYGWYFFQRSAAISGAREGCRAGALQEKDAATTPDEHAKARIETYLSGYGIGCSTGNVGCTISAAYSGSSPAEQLACTVTIDFSSFTGLVWVPGSIVGASVSLLENQD